MHKVLAILVFPFAVVFEFLKRIVENPRLQRLERRIEDLEIALGAIQGELSVMRRVYEGALAALSLTVMRRQSARLRLGTVDEVLRQEIDSGSS
jgi:hypothetical protein